MFRSSTSMWLSASFVGLLGATVAGACGVPTSGATQQESPSKHRAAENQGESTSPTHSPNGSTMNQPLTPYAWIRAQSSVYLAVIDKVETQASGPGMRTTALTLTVDDVLFGPRGAKVRTAKVEEPADATARTKFPAPQWGGVPFEKGTLVLLSTPELGETVAKPSYVEWVKTKDDPAIVSLRQVLAAEATPVDGTVRRTRYLGWLSSVDLTQKLFASAALSQDADLPDIDPKGEVAAAFSRAVSSEKEALPWIVLTQHFWSGVYPRTNEAGRVALLNVLVAGCGNPEESVRDVALDKLSEVPEKDLEMPGITKAPFSVSAISERIAIERAEGPKSRLRKLLTVVQ